MILDFICTYHLFKDNEESNILYKIQLLQAFNLKNFDENKIIEEQNIIFQNFNQYDQIKKLIILLKDKYKLHSSNDNIIFKLLFSYDYFYIFLTCLRELNNNNIISNNNYNKLINIIN